MIRLAITQRVELFDDYGERRDCLDQRWIKFLSRCNVTPLIIPNVLTSALAIFLAAPADGLLLTGGNDLACCNGDAPDRDQVENRLLDEALSRSIPILGVCRGMQLVQHRFGIELHETEGHVTGRQGITVDGRSTVVNSYHRYGSTETVPNLDVWARAEDGVVKAISNEQQKILGVMWHIERMDPFRSEDIAMVRRHFGGRKGA
tara:strand:+ start:32 stop:643 length:612 start_codon:yes stop_codon:yes gene_type:complete